MDSKKELLKKVKKSIKWKQSPQKTAERLGITIDEYFNLRHEINLEYNSKQKETGFTKSTATQKNVYEYKQDLKSGTTTYKLTSSTEPKTAEEIIELLKLDTTKWKLTSYWNKQQGNGWLVSAQVCQIKETNQEVLNRAVEDLVLKYVPVTKETFINPAFEEDVCAVLSLQDIHVGKADLEGSTPEEIVDTVKDCISNLVLRTYHSNKLDKIVFVLGGDLINMDTWLGTTTSGTLVENSTDAYTAFKIAFDLMHWSVNYLKQFCNTLEVIYIPGNHSRLSEAHIAYSLSKVITDPNIVWNVDYAERKVLTYGSNMFCLEHGDFDTKKSFFAFATEFASEWGSTKNRVLYTGHFHKEKTIEYITRDETNGFTLKILPSLTKTDRFHQQGKWTMNKRGGIIEMYSKEKGCLGNFSYYL